MKKRSIRLRACEAKAILEGRQTQIRRVVNCYCNCMHLGRLLGTWGLSDPPYQPDQEEIESEQWRYRWPSNSKPPRLGDWIECYQTDVDDDAFSPVWNPFACELIWCQVSPACRIDLKPKNIRVERMLDISYRDAIACGIELIDGSMNPDDLTGKWKDYTGTEHYWNSPRDSFVSLCESIYGRELITPNPWVWVVDVERIQP